MNFLHNLDITNQIMNYSQYVIGRSHGKTQHGVSLSLLKSALQKFVRRSETEKAVGCLYETNTLVPLENATQEDVLEFQRQNKQKTMTQKAINQFGKAQRTNMANRLLVMCSEEVNIHDHPLIPVYVWRLYKRWLSERHGEESVVHLAQAAAILSNAKKGRLLSYLKSAFDLPPYYVKEKNREKYKNFHQTQVLAKFADVDARSQCEQYDMATFKRCVETAQVEQAFRCLGVLCSTTEHKALFKEIWAFLRKLAFGVPSIQALFEMYSKMTHQERPLYLYHALLLHMCREQIRWDEPMRVPPIPKADPLHTIEDDYTKDHHVSGAKTVHSYVKLLKESFFVPPTHHNREFVQPDYEELYRYIKLAVGHFEEHKVFPTDKEIQIYIEQHFEAPSLVQDAPAGFIESLEHMPLAQRRTGKNKKFVRIDFKGQRIIKGPYRLSEPAYQNALKFNKALALLDANTVGDTAWKRTAWKWEVVYRIDDQHYLVAPLVAVPDLDVQTVRNVESWKGGHSYECYERNSKVLGWRIKDLIDEGQLNDEQTKEAVLQHFYLRYVLGVGDTNVGNMMKVDNTDQLVAGLDLEEVRSNYDQTDKYQLIVGSNVKKQRVVLEPSLGSIARVDWNTLTDEFKMLFTSQELADMTHRDAIFELR